MSVQFYWYLPSTYGGETHQSDTTGTHLLPTSGLPYWIQVAQAAEYAGFDALYLPGGTHCCDPWMIAATLSQYTQRLQLIVTALPETMLPAVMANSAHSMQSITRGRLSLHMQLDYRGEEQRAYGDFLNRDQHYQRISEYLMLYSALWNKDVALPAHRGRYYQLENAHLPNDSKTAPQIYLSAQTPEALRIAAHYADVSLQFAAAPQIMQERIAALTQLPRAAASSVQFACRMYVIARDSEQQAWEDAQCLWQSIVAGASDPCRTTSGLSDGNKILSLHGTPGTSALRSKEIYPNLCSDIFLEDGYPATLLVGSYAQVAKRIREFQSLGIERFLFSGCPSLEETLRLGEELLPRCRM